MEFVNSLQVDERMLEEVHFDIYITAFGSEERFTFHMDQYRIQADLKIAVAFDCVNPDKEKESPFVRNNFEIINISDDDPQNVQNCLRDLIRKTNKRELTVLIDYSCMKRLWYAGLMFFLIYDEDLNSVSVYFTYIPAKFISPSKRKPVKGATSVIPHRIHAKRPEKTALIIGLGVDQVRASYIQKHIKPDITYLLYADPMPHENYVEHVFRNNQEIISSVEPGQMINFPFHDLEKTDEILTNICLDLRMNYNVILAPLGPKVFALNCLLLSLRYPDIDVWKTLSPSTMGLQGRVPTGPPLILQVNFEKEEV